MVGSHSLVNSLYMSANTKAINKVVKYLVHHLFGCKYTAFDSFLKQIRKFFRYSSEKIQKQRHIKAIFCKFVSKNQAFRKTNKKHSAPIPSHPQTAFLLVRSRKRRNFASASAAGKAKADPDRKASARQQGAAHPIYIHDRKTPNQ